MLSPSAPALLHRLAKNDRWQDAEAHIRTLPADCDYVKATSAISGANWELAAPTPCPRCKWSSSCLRRAIANGSSLACFSWPATNRYIHDSFILHVAPADIEFAPRWASTSAHTIGHCPLQTWLHCPDLWSRLILHLRDPWHHRPKHSTVLPRPSVWPSSPTCWLGRLLAAGNTDRNA
ncbi:hypothetical protein LX36DRAFT_178677 [Colletotrichum falcatum]|nr:hypothetical protein LX36DRAFT_178677 [Colletotrichum falcatum]